MQGFVRVHTRVAFADGLGGEEEGVAHDVVKRYKDYREKEGKFFFCSDES